MKLFQLLLITTMFASGIYLYPSLPDRLPTHWNLHGEIDQYSPKPFAVWLMPGIALLLLIGFQVIPGLDPNKEKYRLFRHEWRLIQTALISFITFLHFVILYASLNPGFNLLPAMFFALGSLFVLLGNYLSKIRQNWFLGIRTPWTLSSEENWNRTHRFGSWVFVLAGLLILLEAVTGWFAPPLVFVLIMAAALLPTLYSFLLFKHKL